MKKLKTITSILIIQAMILGNYAWAGSIPTFTKAQQEQISTLSPKININSLLFQNAYINYQPLTLTGKRKVLLYQQTFGKALTEKTKKMIDSLKPDFLVLPEYFFINHLVKDIDSEKSKLFLQRAAKISNINYQKLKELSYELSTTVIGGSLIEESENGNYYNTCYVFHKGKEVGKHRKMELIQMEKDIGLTPGAELNVFEVEGVKIAMLLSSDIFDKKLIEKLEKLGSIDIVFLPISTPSQHDHSDQAFWSKYKFVKWFKRNGTYVVKVGGVGNLLGKKRNGRSDIFGPKVIYSEPIGGENEEIITIELDIDERREHAKKIHNSKNGIIKTDIAPVTPVLNGKEDIYKRLFPDGIPIEDDSFELNNEIIKEIDQKLIKERPHVYYEYPSADFLTRNIEVKLGDKVLDYGTGSGVAAIYAALKGAKYVLGIDNHAPSLDLAKRNVEHFGLKDKVEIRESDSYTKLLDNEKFDTIAFFCPVPRKNQYLTDTQRFDPKGNIIKSFFSGPGKHLALNGKIVLVYPDNPSCIEKIKKLGLQNGLIITKRVKWETDETVRSVYRYSRFYKGGDNEDIDVIRTKLVGDEIYTWSAFTFKRLDEINIHKKDCDIPTKSFDFFRASRLTQIIKDNPRQIKETRQAVSLDTLNKTFIGMIEQAI